MCSIVMVARATEAGVSAAEAPKPQAFVDFRSHNTTIKTMCVVDAPKPMTQFDFQVTKACAHFRTYNPDVRL